MHGSAVYVGMAVVVCMLYTTGVTLLSSESARSGRKTTSTFSAFRILHHLLAVTRNIASRRKPSSQFNAPDNWVYSLVG